MEMTQGTGSRDQVSGKKNIVTARRRGCADVAVQSLNEKFMRFIDATGLDCHSPYGTSQ